MNEYYIQVLDKNDEWVNYDNVIYYTHEKASSAAYNAKLTDDKCYVRIKSVFNPRCCDYGPCH